MRPETIESLRFHTLVRLQQWCKLGCQIRPRTSVKTNNTRRRFWKITNPNHPVLKPDVNARTVALGEISYFEGRHVEKIVAN